MGAGAGPGLVGAEGVPMGRDYEQARPGVVPTVDCQADAAPLPRPFRRLSAVQIENALRAAFADEVQIDMNRWPREPRGPRFRTDALARDLSSLEVEQMAQVATDTADSLNESSFSWSGCDVQTLDCVEFVSQDNGERSTSASDSRDAALTS